MSGHIADLVSRKDVRLLTEAEVRRRANEIDLVDPSFRLDHYIPPGPVARDFIMSNAQTAVIMGPLGGGKTTACVFKRIYAGTLAPIAIHPVDEVRTRMCRWIVLRDTFRSVEKTVLASWQQWFAKGYPGSTWTGGNDRPVTHTLRFMGLDGVRMELVTEFAGLNDSDIESLMKGREYSGAWLNEIDTHAEGALDDVEQRVGRYPSANLLEDADAERMKLVIGDMNAPTIDSWTYPTLVTERKPGRAFYQQPSGRTGQAENRLNLPADYYSRIVENQPEHFVRRMVDNEFGYSRKGKPVHPTFERSRHVARSPIAFNPALDLLIGIDISTDGLSPAAVLGQNSGRLAIIDECCIGQGVGPQRFAQALKTKLDETYVQRRKVRIWVDPAAWNGGDNEGGKLAAVETLQVVLKEVMGLPFDGSNEIGLRLAAVDMELRGYLEPDSALLISPNCVQLIEALAGKYRFKKTSAQATNDFEDKPEKSHPWSDICDGLQYLIGGVRGRRAIIAGSADEGEKRGGASSGWGKAQGGGGWGKVRPGAFDPRKSGL